MLHWPIEKTLWLFHIGKKQSLGHNLADHGHPTPNINTFKLTITVHFLFSASSQTKDFFP